ncbi:hypothetical protein ACR9GW_01240 [Enterobacter ludwigii]
MDESRKAFESWLMEEFGYRQDYLEYWRGEGDYKSHPDLRSRWQGWKASRSVIEIELLADKRRIDWLVSKAVNVRDPMVYGSHSMFWSQAITHEEDDYYETKLREQIDAAMESEKPSAPLESK